MESLDAFLMFEVGRSVIFILTKDDDEKFASINKNTEYNRVNEWYISYIETKIWAANYIIYLMAKMENCN